MNHRQTPLPPGARNQIKLIQLQPEGEPREEEVYLVRDDPESDAPQAYRPIRRHHDNMMICLALPRLFDEDDVFNEPTENTARLVFVKRTVTMPFFRGTEVDPLTEVTSMTALNEEENHHVIPCLEALECNHFVYHVMPRTGFGQVVWHIMETQPGEYEVKEIFKEILANVAHLQLHHFCHGNITHETVLIDDTSLRTMLTNMATSTTVHLAPGDENQSHLMIPQRQPWGLIDFRFMAPEVFNWQQVQFIDGFAADMWSLGMVLFFMLTRQVLCEIPAFADFWYRTWIENNGIETRPELQQFHPQVRVLLSVMLNPNPAQRFTLEQVQELLPGW